jgi:ribose transport system substrate-binding protein
MSMHQGVPAKRWRPATLAGVCLAVLLAAGCGSSGNGSSGNEATGSSTSSTANVPSEVTEQLDAQYAGTPRSLPEGGPKAQPNKTVWIIAVSMKATAAAEDVASIADAAKAIGWQTRVLDGAANYATMSSQIDAAIADHVDGVVLEGIDCPFVAGALKRAKDAGIKVYGHFSFDCDDPGVSENKGEALFAGSWNNFGPLGDLGDFESSFAKSQLLYIAGTSGTSTKVIHFQSPATIGTNYQIKGWAENKNICSECEIWDVEINRDLLFKGQFASQVSAALAEHPDAEWLSFPYDFAITAGGLQAVTQAHSNIKIISNGALPQTLDLIRDGKVTATVSQAAAWSGWVTIDGLNRVFAGQPDVDSGIAEQIIDREHNLPAQGQPLKAPVDYVSHYKQIWGVS